MSPMIVARICVFMFAGSYTNTDKQLLARTVLCLQPSVRQLHGGRQDSPIKQEEKNKTELGNALDCGFSK